MYSRQHHQKIAHVLALLNAPLLRDCECYFAGGTAIALMFDEYRESVDIDFLVSNLASYRHLRELATNPGGMANFFSEEAKHTIGFSEVRADQYGIRTTIVVMGQPVKFEIVLEARIKLERPRAFDIVCGVSTLTKLDLATSKLLANADCWADDAVFNRDVIDLAMMRLPLALLRQGVMKAEAAYGDSIKKDLEASIARLETRPNWLERCIAMLDIRLTKATLWSNVRGLKKVLK
ncbi:MAG: hypothetical protein EBR14_03890 [Methylophilaceae bacterium]|nr:hypothetical protein [Methylophilaceae bacterium]